MMHSEGFNGFPLLFQFVCEIKGDKNLETQIPVLPM